MKNDNENGFQQLRRGMRDSFDLNDLEDLCFDLGIDFDELGTGRKSNRIDELILLCIDEGREYDLLNRLSQIRSKVKWPESFKVPSGFNETRYIRDIARLKQRTELSIFLARKYSYLRLGSQKLTLKRVCTEVLKTAVMQDSLIVVGAPGVGKSGALYVLVTSLISEYDVVYITLDSLEATSIGGISSELRLSHNIVDVLANWGGNKPGFLVLDALDAARSGEKASAVSKLITLIMQKAVRWHVIASMRKFDLRYGLEIKELFAGGSLTDFEDAEFIGVRHFDIPPLTNEELKQIADRSPILEKLITTAPKQLRNLLQLPFTLNLAGMLLTNGVESREFNSFQTQIELLEKYWDVQVIREDGRANSREIILRRLLKSMVSETTMQVSRYTVDSTAASPALLDELLSSHILTEWHSPGSRKPERAVLSFAHHILYDYAVARLLLRGTTRDFVRELSEQKQWALTIRPSIVLHFQYLWQYDPTRQRFWNTALELINSKEARAIGKIIAPGVAVQLTSGISDLEPLLDELICLYPERQSAARYALQHIIGILGTEVADNQYPIVGEGAGPWAILAEKLSERITPELIFLVQRLLLLLLEHLDRLSLAQLNSCGIAARRLLLFAWDQPPRNGWLVKHGIKAVCRTFSSDCDASAALIRRALEQLHLEEFGYEEMPALAEEILSIVPSDPRLVMDIYQKVFEYKETSKKETHFGGQILAFTSNRAQDYEGALFRLAEAFIHFLKGSPDYALQTLIRVVDTYPFFSTYQTNIRKSSRQSFLFRGLTACIERDYSSRWDSELYKHDEPVKMLDSFSKYLNELSQNDDNKELLEKILDLVAQHNSLAVLWKRLLICGISNPQSVGKAIKSLAWSLPILANDDTVNEAANFIPVIYPFLSKLERKQVEETILSITETLKVEHAELLRNFLLRRIPNELIELDEAKELLVKLSTTTSVPENTEPELGLTGWSSHAETEDIRANASQTETHILELTEQVKAFVQTARNAQPSKQEAENIYPVMKNLLDRLTSSNEINRDIFEAAIDYIIEGSEDIVWTDHFSYDAEIGVFLQQVLLMAAKHYKPSYRPGQEEEFDDHISWGIPAPRVSAANGLILLARYEDCLSDAVINAIQELSRDSVPAVRFQIASNCNVLYKSAPQLMWQLVEYLVVNETNKGVLRGLLEHSFRRLISSETDRIVELSTAIFNRAKEENGSERVQELCARLFLHAWLFYNHEPSRHITRQILQNPFENHAAAQRILLNLRDPLGAEFSHSSNPQKDQIRISSLQLFTLLIKAIRSKIEHFNQQIPPMIFNTLSSREQAQIRDLVRLVDNIGTEFYFLSGAFAEERVNQDQEIRERILTLAEKKRFIEDFEPILDELAKIAGTVLFGHGFGNMTHQIIKGLESLVVANPSRVFYWFGKFIKASGKSGYQYEVLGAKQVIDIIRLYLSQYREIVFTKHQDTLIEILDIFVDAGWREAIELTYRLDEIFR